MTTATLRRARVGLVAAAVATALVAAPTAAHHGGATTGVTVRANTFDPFEAHVAPGGTVMWSVLEGGHTIVADDGRFRFPGGDGATMPAGANPSFTVGTADERIRYYCSVHGNRGGQGMAGVVVVGDPQPPVAQTPVVAVPGDVPTIEAAVAVVPPGGRVEIAPGTYVVSSTVTLDRTAVTLTGTGGNPTDVTIVTPPGARGLAESVFRVTAPFVTIANLTVTGARTAGVHVDTATAAEVRDVRVRGDGLTRDGVLITAAQGAGLQRVTVRDVRRAGIRVEPCGACGVSITGADVRGALAGVLATGARGVVVRASTFRGNAVGVVARGAGVRSSTVDVIGNEIVGNTAREHLPPGTDPDRRLATGAGVHFAGAADSRIAANRIEGQRFGVVVTDGALRLAVTGNVLDDNGTDLAWDGVGAQTCFAGHANATSSPPAIETLYPCDRPSAGVPYPAVTAALLVAAYGP